MQLTFHKLKCGVPMYNFKKMLGLFVVPFLFLVGCSDYEHINSPLHNTSSDLATLSKNSNSLQGDTPPLEGIVVEGVSVPGVALGSTREQVEIAYGEPQWCQSSGNPGNQAYCSFPVDGGGQVNVHYRSADGGIANGTADDVAFKIEWTEAVSGWSTTAGINTTLAKEIPGDVISAYPNAQVVYNQFGNIYSVIDYPLGIEVLWIPDFYTGQTHIQMAIFYSLPDPPAIESYTRVASINLISKKIRGKRQVEGFVKVVDVENFSVQGANVIINWSFPDGSIQMDEAVTSSSGNAHFEINDVPRGRYSLHIQNVVLEGYIFDSDNSILNKNIDVR